MDNPPTPGGNDNPASVVTSGMASPPSMVSSSDVASSSHAVDAPCIDLLVRYGPVGVKVERLTLLERGDLGLVDHDIEQDPRRLDPHLGVVIDREVAERMRGGERGKEQDRDPGGHSGRRHAPSPSSGGARIAERAAVAASHGSEGTRSTVERMTARPRGASRTVGYTRPMAPSGTAGHGLFITIEGPEGGGKTTQAERLRDHLAGRQARVHLTREPGGTWLGERIREVLLARTGSTAATDPVTDALLFNAARRQLVGEVIRPALAAGTTVICGRYADSTLAYQGYGAGVPLEDLRRLAAIATGGLTPDLTILLDLPVEVGLARKAPGDVTRFEAEFDLAFHRRVRDGFLAIADGEPERFVIVDATRDVRTVAAEIAAVVEERRVAIEPGAARVRNTS